MLLFIALIKKRKENTVISAGLYVGLLVFDLTIIISIADWSLPSFHFPTICAIIFMYWAFRSLRTATGLKLILAQAGYMLVKVFTYMLMAMIAAAISGFGGIAIGFILGDFLGGDKEQGVGAAIGGIIGIPFGFKFGFWLRDNLIDPVLDFYAEKTPIGVGQITLEDGDEETSSLFSQKRKKLIQVISPIMVVFLAVVISFQQGVKWNIFGISMESLIYPSIGLMSMALIYVFCHLRCPRCNSRVKWNLRGLHNRCHACNALLHKDEKLDLLLPW
jgi:hypothetical protein